MEWQRLLAAQAWRKDESMQHEPWPVFSVPSPPVQQGSGDGSQNYGHRETASKSFQPSHKAGDWIPNLSSFSIKKL